MLPLVLLLALPADPCADAPLECRMAAQTSILEWTEYAGGLRVDLDACLAVRATATATGAPGAIGARLVANQVEEGVAARDEAFHFGDAAIGALVGAGVVAVATAVVLLATSGSAHPAQP